MSKYCTIVFNTKELVLNIAKYLSALNIYQLFNIQICLFIYLLPRANIFVYLLIRFVLKPKM